MEDVTDILTYVVKRGTPLNEVQRDEIRMKLAL
jgi:hypothetical protein